MKYKIFWNLRSANIYETNPSCRGSTHSLAWTREKKNDCLSFPSHGLLKNRCHLSIKRSDKSNFQRLSPAAAVSWISPFPGPLHAGHVRLSIIFKRGIEISALITRPSTRCINGTPTKEQNLEIKYLAVTFSFTEKKTNASTYKFSSRKIIFLATSVTKLSRWDVNCYHATKWFIIHCQRHNGHKALSTLTHLTHLVQSRSFNKLWNLSQTSAWFYWHRRCS